MRVQHKNYHQVKAKTNYELGLQLGEIFKSEAQRWVEKQREIGRWQQIVENSKKHLRLTEQYFPQYIEELIKLISDTSIRELGQRGPYVFQPEMDIPTIRDKSSGDVYTYIDRNFFSTDGQNYRFMGGFRSLMPVDSQESKMGRNHYSKKMMITAIINIRI